MITMCSFINKDGFELQIVSEFVLLENKTFLMFRFCMNVLIEILKFWVMLTRKLFMRCPGPIGFICSTDMLLCLWCLEKHNTWFASCYKTFFFNNYLWIYCSCFWTGSRCVVIIITSENQRENCWSGASAMLWSQGDEMDASERDIW